MTSGPFDRLTVNGKVAVIMNIVTVHSVVGFTEDAPPTDRTGLVL